MTFHDMVGVYASTYLNMRIKMTNETVEVTSTQQKIPIARKRTQKEAPTVQKSIVSPKEEGRRADIDRDLKTVKGMFKFYEIPGGMLEFYFRKYKSVPTKKYTFWDNQTYEVPLMVAKHLNSSGWYPIHRHAQNDDGTRSQVIGQKVRRYGFTPLDFIVDAEDELKNSIVTVEKI